MNFAIEIDFVKGLMIGVRHFDPEEFAPYYEMQVFLLILRVNFYYIPRQEEEE